MVVSQNTLQEETDMKKHEKIIIICTIINTAINIINLFK